MKKLALTFATLVFSLSLSGQANAMKMDQNGDHNHAETTVETIENTEAVSGDVHVSVNGLVCDFCARALEKVFGKQDAVNDIDVNLDSKIITIDFKDGQRLDDEKIKQLIQESGYNVESIHHVE